MREVLYVSERKLEFMFVDAANRSRLPRVVDSSIGVPGVMNFKLAPDTTNPSDASHSTMIATKLERVIKFLDQTHRPADITTSTLHPHQWTTFDLDMAYGTVYEDTAWPAPDGDVALFAGVAQSSTGTDDRPVDVLLCGSVNHFRHRVSTSSRMGSDTRWLYDFVQELETRDQQGVHVPPEFPTARGQGDSLVEAARGAFLCFMNWTSPKHRRGRLRGHARVLFYDDDPGKVTRLVLATPLYVEIPPLVTVMKRRWLSWVRRG